MWGEISDKAKFAFDKEGLFVAPNSVFMLLGSSLPELTAYLNSDLAEYAFSTMGTLPEWERFDGRSRRWNLFLFLNLIHRYARISNH